MCKACSDTHRIIVKAGENNQGFVFEECKKCQHKDPLPGVKNR